jgi:hypothetical protein
MNYSDLAVLFDMTMIVATNWCCTYRVAQRTSGLVQAEVCWRHSGSQWSLCLHVRSQCIAETAAVNSQLALRDCCQQACRNVPHGDMHRHCAINAVVLAARSQ